MVNSLISMDLRLTVIGFVRRFFNRRCARSACCPLHPGEPGCPAYRQTLASPYDRPIPLRLARPSDQVGWLPHVKQHARRAPPFRQGAPLDRVTHRNEKDHPHCPDILSLRQHSPSPTSVSEDRILIDDTSTMAMDSSCRDRAPTMPRGVYQAGASWSANPGESGTGAGGRGRLLCFHRFLISVVRPAVPAGGNRGPPHVPSCPARRQRRPLPATARPASRSPSDRASPPPSSAGRAGRCTRRGLPSTVAPGRQVPQAERPLGGHESLTPSFTLADVRRSLSLSDLTRMQLEVISFFLLSILLCARIIQFIWNSLREDFPIGKTRETIKD